MARSAERVTVGWLKDVLTGVDGRVATRLPAHATFPFVVVREIGGGDTAVAVVNRPYMQIDCYDDTDRATADNVALQVVDAAKYEWPWRSDAEQATVLACDFVAKRTLPEPDTGWHRFTVDLLVAIREDQS